MGAALTGASTRATPTPVTERDPSGGPAHPSRRPSLDPGHAHDGRGATPAADTHPTADAHRPADARHAADARRPTDTPRPAGARATNADGANGSTSSRPPRGAAPDDDPRRVLPELVRRIFEAGIERLAEGPENVRQRLGDIKLPKEALSALFAQIDEGRSGLYRALTRELRDFLEDTNFTEELVRALTMLSFEIKMEIRLIPNDSGRPRPRVKSNLRVHHDEHESALDEAEHTKHVGKRP